MPKLELYEITETQVSGTSYEFVNFLCSDVGGMFSQCEDRHSGISKSCSFTVRNEEICGRKYKLSTGSSQSVHFINIDAFGFLVFFDSCTQNIDQCNDIFRFDLIYLMLDKYDETLDRKLATHLVRFTQLLCHLYHSSLMSILVFAVVVFR